MLNLIYLSACGALGYGNPRELLRLALRRRIDALDHPNISASTDRRGLLGSQQQAAIKHMNIQIHPTALAEASSF
jgi:hypothetical protein